MRKILLAGAASLGLMVAPAHAETLYESGRYDATIGNPVASLTINTCPDLCFGGFTFAAPGLPMSRVVVTDTSGTPIGVVVAQDFNGNVRSGEPGEPRVAGCGGALDLSTSTVAFDPSKPVAVFVHAVNPACAGIGTSGTIDLYVVS